MIYTISNIGKRGNNEDAVLVGNKAMRDVDMVLDSQDITQIGVFDGVGGNDAGEVASEFVAEKFGRLSAVTLDAESLALEVDNINNALFEFGSGFPQYWGMATTACFVKFVGFRVLIFNIGDSKIYRYRAGKITQISVDDVPMHREGIYAHGITACFGKVIRSDRLHILDEPMYQDDVYLLCTDGVSDIVSEAELADILSSNDINVNAERFKELMSTKPISDNYSMVIYRR